MRKSLATLTAALLTALPVTAPAEQHDLHHDDRRPVVSLVVHHPTTSTH